MSRSILVSFFLLAAACASPPRPTILSELDAVRDGNAVREARNLVPQADAKAEKLRNQAEASWPKGQTASSEIAAERALVAYSDASTLARIVKAEQRLAATKADAHQAELLLQALESDQKKAAAESLDLDAQLRVAREAESIVDSKPASADRERARLIAARTAVAQARLLCVSAKLVAESQSPAAQTGPIEATLSELESLRSRVEQGGKPPTPIAEAIKIRSLCQKHLTEIRRPRRMENPVSEAADHLFGELAHAGFAPSRDDRGIVVTLHDAFQKSSLAPKTLTKLAELGQLAQRFDPLPLMVVTHSLQGNPNAVDRQRGDAAAASLRSSGVKTVQVQSVGGRLPLVLPRDVGQVSRNERLEVIFVTLL